MLKREIKRRVFLYRIYLLFGRIFFSERLATISLCDEIRHKSQYKVYDLMLRLFYLQDRCLTTILIDSQGGYVDGADYIIDSIHNTTHYVNVVNVGMCCSAAVDIYLSCCNGYATKNSYFIIHHTKTSIRWGFRNGKRVDRKILKLVERYDKDFYQEISQDIQDDECELCLNKEQWNQVAEILERYSKTFYSHIKGVIYASISSLEKDDAYTEYQLLNVTRIPKEMLIERIGGGKDWYISAQEALNLGICREII